MISFSLFITKATMWVMSNVTDGEFTSYGTVRRFAVINVTTDYL